MTAKTPDAPWHASWLASLPKTTQDEFLGNLTPAELEVYLGWWKKWARPAQRPPIGDWRIWLLLAGRGFGKTRTGAEYVRAMVGMRNARRIALVAPTASDARGVMVEGESGLLSVGPPGERPDYEPSKHLLTWSNGAIATTYSADEPDACAAHSTISPGAMNWRRGATRRLGTC